MVGLELLVEWRKPGLGDHVVRDLPLRVLRGAALLAESFGGNEGFVVLPGRHFFWVEYRLRDCETLAQQVRFPGEVVGFELEQPQLFLGLPASPVEQLRVVGRASAGEARTGLAPESGGRVGVELLVVERLCLQLDVERVELLLGLERGLSAALPAARPPRLGAGPRLAQVVSAEQLLVSAQLRLLEPPKVGVQEGFYLGEMAHLGNPMPTLVLVCAVVVQEFEDCCEKCPDVFFASRPDRHEKLLVRELFAALRFPLRPRYFHRFGYYFSQY